MRWSSAVAVLGLAPAVLLSACGEGPPAGFSGGANVEPEAGGTAVVCALSMPDVLNPFTTPDQLTKDLRWLLYTPLVRYDSAGVQPYLARSWTFEDEQRTLVFTIRDDVRWHDGQRLTAQDVAWTVRIAADTAYAYFGGSEFGGLRESTARDSVTVVLRFAEPLAAGLEPFTGLAVLPRHLLESIAPADLVRAEYNRAPVGSGPYRFAGRDGAGNTSLDRVADYPEDLGRGLLDRIVLRELPEATTMMAELRTGGVDVCVTGSSRARDVQASGLTAVAVLPAGVQVIPLDNAKPPFNDVRVRRALSAALNRAELAQTISPIAQPAGTFMPAGDTRWTDPSLRQPDNDSARAVLLLDSAGWRTIGPDGIRRNVAGQPLRFTIVAPQPLQNLLTVVQAQLRRAGVDAELRFMEGGAFGDAVSNPDSRPAALALTFISERFLNPDPYAELHSGGDSNLSNYRDPRVDSLVQRLRDVLPDDERARIYRELQQRVSQDVPLLYTVFTPRVLAVGQRLQGVTVDLNGPLGNVSEWWIPASQRRRGPAASADTSARTGSAPAGS
ncbi:MAG: ABC transporter substrate-binding protein [Longimicrobiales bacterium]